MTTAFEALETIFHEPKRLAIMSELCGSRDGCSFAELKQACELTDGNLSRHLTALQKAAAVRLEKTFVELRPRTTVFLTDTGRESFLSYLSALEDVLKNTAKAARAEQKAEQRSEKRSRAASLLGGRGLTVKG